MYVCNRCKKPINVSSMKICLLIVTVKEMTDKRWKKRAT